MPTSVHNSQTSPIAAAAERSLLRELGLPVSIGAGDVSSHWAHEGCAALFLAGMQRRGLRFVQRREVARRKARIAGLDELGTVELSWAVEKAHDVVLSLPAASSRCSSATAARARSSSPRARRDAARRCGEAARGGAALQAAARQARARALLDEHRATGPRPAAARSRHRSGDGSPATTRRTCAPRSTASPRHASPATARCCCGTASPGRARRTRCERSCGRGATGARRTTSPIPSASSPARATSWTSRPRAAARTSPTGASSCSRTPASSCPRPRARTPGRACRAC